MPKATAPILIGLMLLAALGTAGGALFGASAETSTPAQTCRKAEVNPVTGYTFCFDPIGATVEPPPAGAEIPCRTDSADGEAWTWGPKCKS